MGRTEIEVKKPAYLYEEEEEKEFLSKLSCRKEKGKEKERKSEDKQIVE